MKQAFKLSFSLRNTYFVNAFIYSFQQIPLLGRLIPETIYAVDGLKVLANIIVAGKEIVTTFINKFLYIALFIFLPLAALDGNAHGDQFVHIFFFLTLAGAIANTGVFNPTKDKYYAVILMRMNAKKYAIADYLYRTIKNAIGMMIFTIIFGLLAKASIWNCILITFFIPAAKSVYISYALNRYKKSEECVNENHMSVVGWIIIILLTAVAYEPLFLRLTLPSVCTGLFMIVVIVGSIPCMKNILTFSMYREMYQQLLQERRAGIDAKVTSKNIQRVNSRNKISTDISIISNRHGFEYFNELFMKRHKKVLWRPVLVVTVISVIVWVAAMIAIYVVPGMKDKLNHLILTMLPYTVFVMYMINRGTSFTTVLFMNCDHCMLTYNFYKSPQFILRLFTIRLRGIVKVNLLPAAFIAAGLTVLLYVSGGTTQLLNYVIVPVSILAWSIFFSVHYLVLYYLLQPYNIETDLKSKTYQIIVSLTYFITFSIMKMEMDTYIFGICAILFCIAYCFIACILVYRFADKTFRLRN